MTPLPFVSSTVAAVRREPVDCLAIVISIFSLWWSFMTNTQIWASSGIRTLIAEEARASLFGNVDRAIALYCSDALVRDWGSNDSNAPHPLQSWQGITEIRKRYRDLPQFESLQHVDINVVEVNIFAGTARAISSTDGIILEPGLGNRQIFKVASVNGDLWEFRKENRLPFLPWTGQWRIASFTYSYAQ